MIWDDSNRGTHLDLHERLYDGDPATDYDRTKTSSKPYNFVFVLNALHAFVSNHHRLQLDPSFVSQTNQRVGCTAIFAIR